MDGLQEVLFLTLSVFEHYFSPISPKQSFGKEKSSSWVLASQFIQKGRTLTMPVTISN